MNELPRLIDIDEVKRLTGMSRSWIYTRQDFPKRVKVGPKCVRWVESEVVAWIATRRAA